MFCCAHPPPARLEPATRVARVRPIPGAQRSATEPAPLQSPFRKAIRNEKRIRALCGSIPVTPEARRAGNHQHGSGTADRAERGIDECVLQGLPGQASGCKITRQFYIHTTEDAKKAALATLNPSRRKQVPDLHQIWQYLAISGNIWPCAKSATPVIFAIHPLTNHL